MNNLIRLLGRRLIALPIMAIGVTILVFFIMSLSPIDQAYTVLGESATEEMAHAYRLEHGLYDPIVIQYFHYLGNVLQGDFGVYGASRAPVVDALVAALPVTLELSFLGLIIGLILSVILGVVSALYRDKWPDQVIRIFSIICISMPSFWLAVLMILLFSANLGWLPASGDLPAFTSDPGGWLARMIMPSVAIAIPMAGQMIRIIRTSVVEELDKDYVRTARGAGIPYGTVVAKNVLRNALISPVTVLGMKIAHLIAGAVVIEVIFNLPGMGMLIMRAITANYVALAQGVVLVVAFAFIIINMIVDMLYLLIDPRIRSV